MILPEVLRDDVAGYELERTALGEAAETYRLAAPGRPTRYLKMAGELAREHARLLWAAGRLPVPRVRAFATEAGHDYLLLDELPGTPIEAATESSVAERVEHLARTLRSLHRMSITECPFDARAHQRLVDAEANVRADPTGLLDLGRLGVADRYQDIALVLRDIEGDYGAEWRAPFAAAYGLDAMDASKLAFFRLLDELF